MLARIEKKRGACYTPAVTPSCRRRRIQLVFPAHEAGCIPHSQDHNNLPPPLGLLTLAAFLARELPEVDVEVFDGNRMQEAELLRHLDAEWVGLGVWFSNYHNGLALASKLKKERPEVRIVIGGPHTAFLAGRILRNNSCIDYVVAGDGEIPLLELLRGVSVDRIPNLSYRAPGGVLESGDPEGRAQIVLDRVPAVSLDALQTRYQWRSLPTWTSQSAFPVSAIRGCSRVTRCEYCSIPTLGVRTKRPVEFWNEIGTLYERDGIDLFFETGDIFFPAYARRLLEASVDHPVGLKIYTYPGCITEETIGAYTGIHVRYTFIGVESVLVWNGGSARKYRQGYDIESLLQEVRLLGDNGIRVMPGFVLGLPEESDASLRANAHLIKEVTREPAVNEFAVNIILPLPGSEYFNRAMQDDEIVRLYGKATGLPLLETDKIDYHLLSNLFVNRFCKTSYEEVQATTAAIYRNSPSRMAHWDTKIPLLSP